jgi:hypothetical protein
MKQILFFLLCIVSLNVFGQVPEYRPTPDSVGDWISFGDTLYRMDRMEKKFLAFPQYRLTNHYLQDGMFREYRWQTASCIFSAWAYQWGTGITRRYFSTPLSISQQPLIQSLRREVDSLIALLKTPDTLYTYRMVSCTLKSSFWNQIDNSLYARKVYKITYADGSIKYLDHNKKPFRAYYKIWEYQ